MSDDATMDAIAQHVRGLVEKQAAEWKARALQAESTVGTMRELLEKLRGEVGGIAVRLDKLIARAISDSRAAPACAACVGLDPAMDPDGSARAALVHTCKCKACGTGAVGSLSVLEPTLPHELCLPCRGICECAIGALRARGVTSTAEATDHALGEGFGPTRAFPSVVGALFYLRSKKLPIGAGLADAAPAEPTQTPPTVAPAAAGAPKVQLDLLGGTAPPPKEPEVTKGATREKKPLSPTWMPNAESLAALKVLGLELEPTLAAYRVAMAQEVAARWTEAKFTKWAEGYAAAKKAAPATLPASTEAAAPAGGAA